MLLYQYILVSNTWKICVKAVHTYNHLNMNLHLHTCILDYYVAAENN